MTKTVDLTKPVQTKNGLPVRIICTDVKSPRYPIAALVMSDGSEGYCTYTANGKYYFDEDNDLDLVNIPEKKVTFLNVYTGSTGFEKDSLEDAEAVAAERLRACGDSRLALLKLTRVDGKITKTELVA